MSSGRTLGRRSHCVQSGFSIVGTGVVGRTRSAHLSPPSVFAAVMFGSLGSPGGALSRSVSPLAQPCQVEYSSARPNAAWPSSCMTTSRKSVLRAVANTLPLAHPPRIVELTMTAAACQVGRLAVIVLRTSVQSAARQRWTPLEQ